MVILMGWVTRQVRGEIAEPSPCCRNKLAANRKGVNCQDGSTARRRSRPPRAHEGAFRIEETPGPVRSDPDAHPGRDAEDAGCRPAGSHGQDPSVEAAAV